MKVTKKVQIQILLYALKGGLDGIAQDEIDLDAESSILETIIELFDEL